MDIIITSCLLYYKCYLYVLYYFLLSSLYNWGVNIRESEYSLLIKEKQHSVLWVVHFVKSIHNSRFNNCKYVLFLKCKYQLINREVYYIMGMICKALYEQFFQQKWKHINNQINEITKQTSNLSPSDKIILQQKIKDNDTINKCSEHIENIINGPIYKKNIKEKGLENIDSLVKKYLNIIKTI